MKISIRQCSADEVNEVGPATGMATKTAKDYVVRQDRHEGVFLGAWADGTPVGYVFLKWNPELPDGYGERVPRDFADMENLFVVEAYRSKGVGSAIIREAERTACARGCAALCVAVDPERNPGAHELYVRRGFSDIGLPAFDASGQETGPDGEARPYEEWCIYMIKQIRGRDGDGP